MAISPKLRVLVLYGGEAATHPRNELLAWLGTKQSLKVEPFIVSGDVPHSEGSVDDRVDAAIGRADKAIAILTPDVRSQFGAPNVMDEIGRWRGRKGKKTLCILRQDGVPSYSNHAGIVYVSFRERISEAFDELREFLLDEIATMRHETSAQRDLIIDASPNMILLNGHRFRIAQLDEFNDQLTVEVIDVEGDGESVLRGLLKPRAHINLAYGNMTASGRIEESRLTHRERSVAAVLQIHRVPFNHSELHEMSWGGANAMSADEIAALRASRILFGDPPASRNEFGPEMLIRGGMRGGLQITESPIPSLLAQLPRTTRDTWEIVRLLLVQQLRTSGCVEHIELLRLTVRSNRLVRIEFRGRRATQYANIAQFLIEFDRPVDF